MGNATNDAKKTNGSTGVKAWSKSVKAQFKRIIWPTKEEVIEESAVVLGVSVILGLIIAVLDRVLLLLVDLIISI